MSSFLNNFPFETKMGKTKTVAVTKTFCLRTIEVMSLGAMFVFFGDGASVITWMDELMPLFKFLASFIVYYRCDRYIGCTL